MTRSGTVAIFFAILILSGCARVTVTKLSPDSDTSAIKGQRFSLPRPYIQVTPQTDGSISADIVYLPDPERTYAVNSISVFASDSLEVSTEGGIVRTINWTGDSSAVVAEAIPSAGTAASGILQAEQRKKAEQKAKEDTASKLVDEAQLELQQAQSQLAILLADNTASPGEIRQARIAVDNAALKLGAAQAALARLRGTTTSNSEFREKEYSTSKAIDEAQSDLEREQRNLETLMRRGASRKDIEQAQDAVEKARGKLKTALDALAEVTGQVFGPKLFAIHEEIRQSTNKETTSPFLQIVTVEQKTEPPQASWNPRQPLYPVKWLDAQKPPKVRIFPEGINIIPNQSGSKVLTLQASVPLFALVDVKTRLEKNGGPAPPPLPAIKLASLTVIEVNLQNITQKGDYTLHLAYQTREHNDPNEEDGTRPIKIRIN